jgi:hypothetical protein
MLAGFLIGAAYVLIQIVAVRIGIDSAARFQLGAVLPIFYLGIIAGAFAGLAAPRLKQPPELLTVLAVISLVVLATVIQLPRMISDPHAMNYLENFRRVVFELGICGAAAVIGTRMIRRDLQGLGLALPGVNLIRMFGQTPVTNVDTAPGTSAENSQFLQREQDAS